MTTLEEHLTDENTHTNLTIDGNAIVESELKTTLSEHEVDGVAHQNIILDGNK